MFEIHPGGNLITLLPKWRHLRTPVSPQLLNGYMSDENIKIDHSFLLHGIDFLPMPVHESPLMCLFYRPRIWTARYVDSIKNISLLRTIIECFRFNPYLPMVNHAAILAAHNQMTVTTTEMEREMYVRIEQTAAPMDFVHLMEQYTLRRIHLLEECIWRMFLAEQGVPLEVCLTPKETPALRPETDKKTVARLLSHYFDTKQHVRNVRLDKALPEDAPPHEFRQYFDVEDMETRIFEESELYNGYLDRRTVQEYMNYCKTVDPGATVPVVLAARENTTMETEEE